jgi:RNA polymerase sigma-70 factor, ECF subfamily
MLSDEAEAIRLCQSGDIGGLEILVARHQQAAARLAFLLTGDRFLAEDIIQESFLAVFRSIRSFRADQAFAPWLYGIVTNVARNMLRRASRRHEVSLATVAGEAESLAGAADPHEQAERGETHSDMLRALEHLPAKQREAVILRYYFGFKDSEIAQIVGCRPGTARERLSAGLRTLTKVIREQYPWLFRESGLTLISPTTQEEHHGAIQRRA